VVIAGLTAVFIVPIWTAVFPPMTDFGAQLIMADVWARYDELPNAATNFVLHTEWSAQRAPARLAAWLYPTVTPLITLKLYLSVALALCSLGLCLVARAFDRSPWLVVLCLPGLWGGMMALGVLHYVFSYGFILASAAFGRWAAVREDRWPLLGILLANLGACMVHGVGFVFAMLFGAVAFVASAPRLRQWVAVLAFLPPLAIWLSWTTEHTGQGEMFSGGLLTVVQEHATWASATGRITWFIHQGHDILTDGTDTYLALVLGALWLVLMATAAPSETVSAGAPLRERVREHALLTLVIVVGVTAFLLPSNIKNTEINSRLITPFPVLGGAAPAREGAEPHRRWGAGVRRARGAGLWGAPARGGGALSGRGAGPADGAAGAGAHGVARGLPAGVRALGRPALRAPSRVQRVQRAGADAAGRLLGGWLRHVLRESNWIRPGAWLSHGAHGPLVDALQPALVGLRDHSKRGRPAAEPHRVAHRSRGPARRGRRSVVALRGAHPRVTRVRHTRGQNPCGSLWAAREKNLRPRHQRRPP
jgi:hypothetical protein